MSPHWGITDYLVQQSCPYDPQVVGCLHRQARGSGPQARLELGSGRLSVGPAGNVPDAGGPEPPHLIKATRLLIPPLDRARGGKIFRSIRRSLVPSSEEAGRVSIVPLSVQPEFGDVARVLLQFAALDALDDVDEALVGAGLHSDLLPLAHDKAVEELDLGAPALGHVLAH
jgi:hypothetical protein